MLFQCLASCGASSRSTSWMASLVCAPASRWNTLLTRMSASPAFSSAAMVLAKVGSAGSAAMALTSAACAEKARANAGGKCSRLDPPERRHPERAGPVLEQRIVGLCLRGKSVGLLIHAGHMGLGLSHRTLRQAPRPRHVRIASLLNFSDVKQRPRLLDCRQRQRPAFNHQSSGLALTTGCDQPALCVPKAPSRREEPWFRSS